MTTKTIFTLLGTGSSGGVPRIGNDWGACDPNNSKNRRQRCSMLVEQKSSDGKTSVLIDCGPDMREQLLQANVQHLDAVLLTHAHADHIFGMDDLRQLTIKHRERVNVYMDEVTSKQVMSAFGYCYLQAPGSTYPAILNEHRIVAAQPLTISGKGGDINFTPFDVNHGDIPALGFRINKLAYMPDVKSVEDQCSLKALQDLDVLIIDALRYSEHHTHMNVDEALAFIKQVKPHRAILTNMHNSIDFEGLSNKVPAGVELAYDGLQIYHP